MALTKVNYVDNETVITAANMNAIQDEVIKNGEKLEEHETALSVDVVVEQGTSGVWGYRKWASGIAECWCRHSTNVTSSNNLNGVYYCPTVSVDFPFAFTAVPTVSITGGSTDVVNWAREFASKASCASYVVCSNANLGEHSVVVDIHAIGKWK